MALWIAGAGGTPPADDLAAPRLLASETTSVLHARQWRGDLSADEARTTFARLLELDVRVHDEPGLPAAAWAIADELGWAKTYDAEYLAVARALGTVVVTIDLRLRRGADRTGLVRLPDEL